MKIKKEYGINSCTLFCVRYENICELKNVVVSYLNEKQLMEKISCFFCIIFMIYVIIIYVIVTYLKN